MLILPKKDGDVTGPNSASDNAICRFDGTSGKVIQNSAAFIDDSGNMGLGTSTPTEKLDVLNSALIYDASYQSNSYGLTNGGAAYGSNAEPMLTLSQNAGSYAQLLLKNGDGSMNNSPCIGFSNLNGSSFYTLGASITCAMTASGGGSESQDLVFSTQAGGAALTEHMRLASTGALTVKGPGSVSAFGIGNYSLNMTVVEDLTNYRGIYLGYDAGSPRGIIAGSTTGGNASSIGFLTYNGSNWGEILTMYQSSYISMPIDGTYLKLKCGSGGGTVDIYACASSGSTSTFKFPTDNGTNNYVLKTDGSGNTSWGVASGDVVGPNSSTDWRVAFFDGTTGKLLKEGRWSSNSSGYFVGEYNGSTHADLNLYNTSNQSSTLGPATSGSCTFRLPGSDGTNGYGLKTDGSGNTSWGIVGDVTGPGSSTANNLAYFSDTSGKVIADSGIAYTSIVTGPGSSTANNIPYFTDTTGKVLGDSGILYTALVTGPGSTTTSRVALWNNTSGTLLADGPAHAADGTTSPVNSITISSGIITAIS